MTTIITWAVVSVVFIYPFFWALRRMASPKQDGPHEDEDDEEGDYEYIVHKTVPHVAHTEYPRYKTSFNIWVKYWQSKGVFISSNKQFSNN